MFESGRTLKRVLSDFFSYEVYHSRRCVDLENPRFGEVVVNCNCTALGIVVLERNRYAQATAAVKVLYGEADDDEKWYSTGVISSVEECEKEIKTRFNKF